MDMLYNGEACRIKLVQWNKQDNPSKSIHKLQERIMMLRKGAQTRSKREELARQTVKLEKLYLDQAMYWRQ